MIDSTWLQGTADVGQRCIDRDAADSDPLKTVADGWRSPSRLPGTGSPTPKRARERRTGDEPLASPFSIKAPTRFRMGWSFPRCSWSAQYQGQRICPRACRRRPGRGQEKIEDWKGHSLEEHTSLGPEPAPCRRGRAPRAGSTRSNVTPETAALGEKACGRPRGPRETAS